MKNLFKDFFKPKYDSRRYDSLISADVVINGPIEYSGSIVINGQVNSTITAKGAGTSAVTVSGIVAGDSIIADFVVVEKGGQVMTNSVTARIALIVKAGGHISATTIKYGDLELSKGAIITGQLNKIDALATEVVQSYPVVEETR